MEDVSRRDALRFGSAAGLVALGFPAALAAADRGGAEPRAPTARVKIIGIGESKIAHGSTAPGEGWQPYGSNERDAALGTYIDVDTGAAKFKSVPTYFTSLGGRDCHWEMAGVSAIYAREDKDGGPLPLETGFRVYLRYPDDPARRSELDAARQNWYLNWMALGE